MTHSTPPEPSTPGGLSDDRGLVGREQELALVDEVLAAFAAGERPRLVVSGEPGIGKTALLRELRARARARGLRVASGAADELEREMPLGLFVDALDDTLAALGERDLTVLGPTRVAELARVFPSLAEHATSAPGPAAGGPPLHGAVSAALERGAAEGPLMLVLDDLQWADDASLSLLARLLRRPPRRVLLVLAHRSGEVPDLLVRAVGLAASGGEAHHLALAALTPSAAARLLDGIPPVRRREILHDSGGNPFYLSELAASARAEGGAPLTLRAALTAELTALSPDAAELVRAAGVLGDPFDPQLAADVAALPRDVAVDALGELVAADLVRTTDRPERCTFRRPVIAAIARHWAGGPWRTAAHARAAALLAAAGAPTTARARHVERSARVGDAVAVELLAQAAQETLPQDPRGAARWFGAAARLLPAGEQPVRRLGLLLAQAAALADSGSVEDARGPLGEALALLPAVPPEARARALARLARVEAMTAAHPQALELLHRFDGAETPELHATTALTHMRVGRWEPMAASARKALQRTRRSADAQLRTQAAALLSVAERQLGHTAAASAAYAEAESAAREAAPADVAPDGLRYLAVAAELLDRHEASLRWHERLLEVARTSGQEYFVVPALVGRAGAHLTLGRLPEADANATEALEATRDLTDPQALALARMQACRVALARGEVDAAIAHGERAVATAAEVPSAMLGGQAGSFLAAARLAAGDVNRAVDGLLAAGGGLALGRIPPTWRTHWAGVLAQAELMRRRACAANAWSERASVMAVAVGSTGAFAEAELTRAAVLLESGEAAAAQQAAARAVGSFGEIGRRIDATVAVSLYGHALARTGETATGVALLRHGHEALANLGAVREADAAARALRRLGQRAPSRWRAQRPARGSSALSAREREIVALVATGATNRQIAEQLVISEKTVESHLTRVFTKLGVRSRTAVVRALAEG